jgi:hypothetical protein
MHRSTLDLTLGAALLVTVALCAGPARAADWQFNPRVELGVLGDTNYLLRQPGLEDRAQGQFADVLLQLRSVGPIDEVSFAPGVRATYFPNVPENNYTDPSLDFDFTHHGQTMTGGFTSRYSKESVARSDRPTTNTTGTGGGGLGNPTPGDSGYITTRDRRQWAQFSPKVSYDLTQRNRLLLTADYIHVNYDQEIPGYYVGFKNLIGSVGLAHDISQRTTLIIRSRYAHYDPNEGFATTKTVGVEGEWDRHVSEVAQAYVRVGGAHTMFGQVGGTTSPSVNSVVGGAGMNWTYQITSLFLDATRTVDPNSTGYSVVRDQLRLSIERSLTQTFTAIIGARGYRDTATGNSAGFNPRDYAFGTLGARWRFQRAWTIAAQYSYTRQKYQSNPAAATSNAGSLSIIYEPLVRGVTPVVR